MLVNGYVEYASVNLDFKIKRLEDVNKIIVD